MGTPFPPPSPSFTSSKVLDTYSHSLSVLEDLPYIRFAVDISFLYLLEHPRTRCGQSPWFLVRHSRGAYTKIELNLVTYVIMQETLGLQIYFQINNNYLPRFRQSYWYGFESKVRSKVEVPRTSRPNQYRSGRSFRLKRYLNIHVFLSLSHACGSYSLSGTSV